MERCVWNVITRGNSTGISVRIREFIDLEIRSLSANGILRWEIANKKFVDVKEESRIFVLSQESKCLHNMECDECFAWLIEMTELLERFFKLVESAREANMTISSNAFAIKDLEKAYKFRLSKEDSDKIWEKIKARLKADALLAELRKKK